MKLLESESMHGKVSIPVDKITGICEPYGSKYNCYVATGAESEDEENGWYLTESYESVKEKLRAME